MNSAPRRRLFLLVTLVLTLAACEGLAALYRGYTLRSADGPGYPTGFFQADSVLGYRMLADFDGAFTCEAFADIAIRTNSEGYRDGPFVSADSTIALIGDSVVFGAGVRAEDRLDASLEESLEQESGADWEIWNVGVNAYGLDHYRWIFDSPVLKGRRPSRVIIGLCMNDLEHATEAWPYWATHRNLLAKMRQSSSLVWLAFHAWKRLPWKQPEFGSDWTLWYTTTGSRWEEPGAEQRFRKCLEDINAASPSPVLFVIWPTLFELQGGELGSTSRARTLMAEWLTDLGSEFLDPYPEFAAAGPPESLFLPGDPLHFSPAGHRAAGHAIAGRLLSSRTGD